MSLPKMNHTQISNAFIDNWMHQLNPSATLVFLAISRKTIGWHKDTDAISLTTIQEMTGFSRQGVVNAIDDLEKAGLIEAIRQDKKTTKYSINYETVESVDQSSEFTSQLSRLPSQLSRLDEGEKQANLVNSVDTQKKYSFKETIQKKDMDTSFEANASPPELVAKVKKEKKYSEEQHKIFNTYWDGLLKANGVILTEKDHGAQAKACWLLVERTVAQFKTDAVYAAHSVVAAFMSLKNNDRPNGFFKKLPTTPMTLSSHGIWGQVVESMRSNMITPEIQELVDAMNFGGSK